ncbi:MAG: six-hairpin glycosidase [Bacteroidetes bacterium]|nr:six-hairpin glycosidase [Bacteroidota bacterium]
MKKINYLIIAIAALLVSQHCDAQDTVRYVGSTLSNIDYHHGQLSPAIGVHNIQTMRANRASAAVNNWTYNHAPMLAYWNHTFYLEYLSNPVGEHQDKGRSLLQTSANGYHWSDPVVVFPTYLVPDGFVKEGKKDTAKNAFAVMHQRIGFYTSTSNRLFVLGYYGIVLGQKDDPNDGNGIGRVIREVNKDGSFGNIYFLRYNHRFNESNTNYPFYTSSKDAGFVKACEEILNTPLLMQQMVEEADRDDVLIPLKKDFKAFNYYHLPNGHVVGLWKYALTSISKDEGKTWTYNPTRAPGFVNANAKIWGQKTSDQKYATVYNPSEFRWPLAVSVSDDGLQYKNLLLVNGEITSLRYGGAYKSYGPQYVRGIQEMDGTPPDGNMWVTYSMNKEDIWVSKIPVPIVSVVTKEVNDHFEILDKVHALDAWNIYAPLLCNSSIENINNKNALVISDADPFDYAKVERVFPASSNKEISFSITAGQQDFGNLEIELVNSKGLPCVRILLDSTGAITTKQGYRLKSLGKYTSGARMDITLTCNTKTRMYTVSINGGKPSTNLLFAPVSEVERLVFRTGSTRRFPDADTPTDQAYDLQQPNLIGKKAVFLIHNVTTKSL